MANVANVVDADDMAAVAAVADMAVVADMTDMDRIIDAYAAIDRWSRKSLPKALIAGDEDRVLEAIERGDIALLSSTVGKSYNSLWAFTAVDNCQVAALEWICDRWPQALNSWIELVTVAATNGHLRVLDWLARKLPSKTCKRRFWHEIIVGAASAGHVNVLEWTYYAVLSEWRPWVVDKACPFAAGNGRVAVLDWFWSIDALRAKNLAVTLGRALDHKKPALLDWHERRCLITPEVCRIAMFHAHTQRTHAWLLAWHNAHDR